MLFLFVLSILQLAVVSQATRYCPINKKVGDTCYTRVDTIIDFKKYDCYQDCAYKKTGMDDGQLYCFKPGSNRVSECGPTEKGFLAGLAYTFDSSGSPFCAGALVSDRWVVTSASCSYSDTNIVSPASVVVTLGEADNGPALVVDKIILHSGFTLKSGRDNLSLWRLSQAVDISVYKPVCIPSQGSQQTGVARLVGWRITELAGSLSETLQDREVTLDTDCGMPGVLCSTADTTQCGGDYGGPLLQNGKTLVGTTISDHGCGKNCQGKFTQISEYSTWIKTKISTEGGVDVCTG